MVHVAKGHIKALGHQVSCRFDLSFEWAETSVRDVQPIPKVPLHPLLSPVGESLVDENDHSDERQQSIVLGIGKIALRALAFEDLSEVQL